eukprot:ANDGO_00596.mRNA.1 Eukaryotic translation initiation factor 3 subunit C
MSSKFFETGDSSTEESEESYESESSAEESKAQRQPAAKRVFYDSDESEDEGQRVVKTFEEKIADEYSSLSQKIKEHISANDILSLEKDFKDLRGVFDKQKKRVSFGVRFVVPSAFLRNLIRISDTVLNFSKDIKLAPTQGKALGKLQYVLRKHNTEFTEELVKFREHPITSDDEKKAKPSKAAVVESEDEEEEVDEEEEDEASNDEDEDEVEDESEDESDDSDESSDEDSSTSGDSDESSEDEKPKSGLAKWLAKAPAQSTAKASKKPAGAVDKTALTKRKEKEGAPEPQEVPAVPAAETEVSQDNFSRLVKENLEKKLRRPVESASQMQLLEKLQVFAKSPARIAGLSIHMCNTAFESVPADAPLSFNVWLQCLGAVERLSDALLGVESAVVEDHPFEENVEYLASDASVGSAEIKTSTPFEILVNRLDEFWTRLLQWTDPHSSEFLSILADESRLLGCIERAIYFYETRMRSTLRAAELKRLLVEHVYYRKQTDHSVLVDRMRASIAKSASDRAEFWKAKAAGISPEVHVPELIESDLTMLMNALTSQIYGSTPEKHRARVRVMLCHVYHHALHGRYAVARDMLLESHVSDTVQAADETTMVLYNRALVQIGLCAFRCGLFSEAHAVLVDIGSHPKKQELLAQPQLDGKLTDVDERRLRKRMVPLPQFINLQLLEVFHLIAAMLVEIPLLAANRVAWQSSFGMGAMSMSMGSGGFSSGLYGLSLGPEVDASRLEYILGSKVFSRMMEHYSRPVLFGPPESTRDHIYTAALAMLEGDWARCCSVLFEIDTWTGIHNAEDVKAKLKERVKEETMRSYLLSNARIYKSFSIPRLLSMFETSREVCLALISRMILSEEFRGAVDAEHDCVVVHPVFTENSRLRSLSLQLADKNGRLMDFQEKFARDADGSSYDQSYSDRYASGSQGKPYKHMGSFQDPSKRRKYQQ